MTANQIIILIMGTLSIILTYWYFFGRKESRTVISGSSIALKVDAGYSPSQIVIKHDTRVTLKVLRKDPSDCLEDLVLPEWNIKKYLPLNKEIVINLEPKQKGDYPFHCGMNMFHGKIIVK